MATAKPRKPLWVAVDTNVLLDLADEQEHAWGAIETIRRRLPGAQVIVPPTALQELFWIAEHDGSPTARRLARTAAENLVAKWEFTPLTLVPVGHGITERIAAGMRARRLLPEAEVNDSLIVAESALAGCKLLLSSDAHITGISADKLALLLAAADVETILISKPRDPAKRFGQ
jgi:predicted nucleic acid-binding protein